MIWLVLGVGGLALLTTGLFLWLGGPQMVTIMWAVLAAVIGCAWLAVHGLAQILGVHG